MSLVVEVLGFGGIVPLLVATLVTLLWSRWIAADVGSRYCGAVGFAAAFLTGYGLLPACASWGASRHWQWLPYLVLAAMALGPLAIAPGIRLVEQWVLQFLLALVAAWLLVPTWPDLEPARPWLIAVLTSYWMLLFTLLDLLVVRIHGGPLLSLDQISTPASNLKPIPHSAVWAFLFAHNRSTSHQGPGSALKPVAPKGGMSTRRRTTTGPPLLRQITILEQH